MGLIKRVLGAQPAPPRMRSTTAASRLHSDEASGPSTTAARDALKAALRDTLEHNGIPASWIASEVFSSTARDGTQGFHWRLLVKHWDARLATHCIGLENALIADLFQAHPAARDWLTGVSWQFAVKDRASVSPLPPPNTWTAQQNTRARKSAVGVDAARAQLNDLLLQREPDLPANLDSLPPQWSPTRPAKFEDSKKR